MDSIRKVALSGSCGLRHIVGAMLHIDLTGVMNIRTGRLWQCGSLEYVCDVFGEIPLNIRRIWRDWNMVLSIDKHSAHTSLKSLLFARELGVELLFLPTAASRLNLWKISGGI